MRSRQKRGLEKLWLNIYYLDCQRSLRRCLSSNLKKIRRRQYRRILGTTTNQWKNRNQAHEREDEEEGFAVEQKYFNNHKKCA